MELDGADIAFCTLNTESFTTLLALQLEVRYPTRELFVALRKLTLLNTLDVSFFAPEDSPMGTWDSSLTPTMSFPSGQNIRMAVTTSNDLSPVDLSFYQFLGESKFSEDRPGRMQLTFSRRHHVGPDAARYLSRIIRANTFHHLTLDFCGWDLLKAMAREAMHTKTVVIHDSAITPELFTFETLPDDLIINLRISSLHLASRILESLRHLEHGFYNQPKSHVTQISININLENEGAPAQELVELVSAVTAYCNDILAAAVLKKGITFVFNSMN